jgi:diguanylate cyclase (GGDEF)-like protein
MLANRDSSGHNPRSLSYQNARRLATRLGLDRPERLTSLFRDLGLGKLELDIGADYIQVSVTPEIAPDKAISGQGGCELERGLIDGALELIVSHHVTTIESKCWTRGDRSCRFEAQRDDSAGTPRFMPLPASGHSVMAPASSGETKQSMTQSALKSWYMDLTARELARTRRHGRSLTVLYVDLDDLGEINAVHGRGAGDQVISAVAAALCKSCRTEDYLWHNGEDEFAVVLSETDAKSADVVARRLSTEILSAAEYVDVPATVSASIGYSTFPTHGENLSNLFASARSAVYLAKSLGKGRAQAAVSFAGNAGRSDIAGESAVNDRRTVETPSVYSRNETNPVAVSSSAAARQNDPATDEHLAAETQPASIIIASMGPLLIAGMKQVLSEAPGMNVMEELTDSVRFAAAIADKRPDIIFADLQIVQTNDHEMLRMLERDNLPCKCVVFATDVDQDIIKLVADFRVDGVILQDSTAAEIISSLETVYKGRAVMPPEVQAAISELEGNRRLLEELSEREIEVLRLIAEGKSNSQISEDLFITVNTVRFHLANIYQKLSVSNRTEAANYYLRQDLAGPDGQTKLL